MSTPEPHRVAAALLVRDGQALLAHRHPLRAYYPSCWDLVGGHVEVGESPLEALRRECLEELGVVVLDPQPLPLTVSDPGVELHAYVVSSWSGEPRNAVPHEHDDLRWFAPDELADLDLADPAALPELLAALEGTGSEAPPDRPA